MLIFIKVFFSYTKFQDGVTLKSVYLRIVQN